MNLTQDAITGLIRRIAIPASVGMLFNTLYYIVDNFYAGMLSATALAGLSLAAPVFFMGMSIAIGIGQATNALVGNARGAGKDDEAAIYAGHALSFAWLTAIVVGALIYFSAPTLFYLMGARGDYTLSAMEYLTVVLPALVLMTHVMAANGILNSLGDTTSLRNALIIAFFANVLLDPLFMFTFGWGVTGLAAATAVTQLISVVYLTRKIQQSRLKAALYRQNMRPNAFYYRALFAQSLPASTNIFLIALGSLIITSAVARFGEEAVAGLGIALRIEQLVLLPTVGLNIAVLSLVSVNYGAQLPHRLHETARTALTLGTSLMLAGGVLLFLSARPLISLFSDNADVIEAGVSYLRVAAIILPAYVLSFIASAVLQGMKEPHIPLYFNILRQLVFPLSFIFIAIGVLDLGLRGVWFSIALATWGVASAQFLHMRYRVKRIHPH